MRKSEAITALENMAISEAKSKFPSLPHSHFVNTRKYSDNSANKLTKCCIDWLRLNGHHAERINTTGTIRNNCKVVTDCIGRSRQIGTLIWTKNGTTKGSSDIHAVINGRAVFIEIKFGKDFQSEAQKDFETTVTKAGAQYLIIKDFQQLFDWYKKQSPAGTGLLKTL